MNKLSEISKRLENHLRNHKHIPNRDLLLHNMFGNSPFEDKINEKYYNLIPNFAIIGKIFFITVDYEEIVKKDNFNSLLDPSNYTIITNETSIEEIDNKMNFNKKVASNSYEDLNSSWNNIFNQIKNIKLKITNKNLNEFFSFKNEGDEFLISEIMTDNFEKSCQLLYSSSSEQYKKNKLENAIFIDSIQNTIKIIDTNIDFFKLIRLSKDKKSDFKKLYSLQQKGIYENWENVSWEDIKKRYKEEN